MKTPRLVAIKRDFYPPHLYCIIDLKSGNMVFEGEEAAFETPEEAKAYANLNGCLVVERLDNARDDGS